MIEKYIVRMIVDFKNLNYKGYETISGDFTNGENLDFEGLEIDEISGFIDNKPKIENNKIIIEKDSSREIKIKFTGKISEKSLMGIHKSTYDGGYIVTTQMEPTGARSVFPCVDKPSAKAVFKLEVEVNDDLEVISNTPPETAERSEKSSFFSFKETPKMSTYLIYLGIGKFERIKEKYKGRELSVVTTPGKSQQGKFALELLKKIMDEYEKYYEIKYPLEKMDLIAVPQFGAGAMENWGAITFREIAILLNESVSFSFKKEIGKTLSHEMAHQWFGNLVTMDWWDDLWLNESFATFVGNKILDSLERNWHLWEEFLVESTLPSMKKDSLLNTHPIRVPVRDPAEIAEIFDSISYGKGASVLRMIEHFIGEEKFRKGVIEYLKKHSYGNAKGEDLWNSLSVSGGLNIDRIMKTWLEKEGHPYLEVKRENEHIKIVQHRFSYLDNHDNFIWSVPIFYEKNEKEENILMDSREIYLPYSDKFIINPRGIGYYRVLYSDEILKNLFTQNKGQEFKTRLIDDSYAFLLASKINIKDFINFLNYVKIDNNYLLVNIIIDLIQRLISILDNEEINDFSRKYLNEKLQFFRESKDENSSVIVEKIYTILPIIDENFRKKIYRQYQEYEKIPAEERTGVLIAASIEGFKLEKIVDEINKPLNDMEQVRRMVSITMTRDSNIFFRFIDDAKDKPELRGNLLYSLIYATRNPVLRRDLWDWTIRNYDAIYDIYKGSGSISFFIEDLIAIGGIGNRDKVEYFISNIKIPEAERAVKNGQEYLQIYERLIGNSQS
ncbi:MAG: M1 family metallopeptidase [Thermoplasmata archaeon]